VLCCGCVADITIIIRNVLSEEYYNTRKKLTVTKLTRSTAINHAL